MERSANKRFDQKLDATQGAALLTPTQRKVLEGVHLGLLNKQIAFNLGIAEATVKAHMTALMRKLNVRNRTQVAILAQSLNQREPDHVEH
ncbi:MAG TPA: LuxR C-terminal-related transcriptional regulator [Sphingobium sp.]|nr:LuxR C-terminal-related transcriptional regulator [Sphingobium sp.]